MREARNVLDARAEQPRRDPACKRNDPPRLRRDTRIVEEGMEAQNAAVPIKAISLAVDREQESVRIKLHVEGVRGVVSAVDVINHGVAENAVEEQIQQFDE